MYKYLSEQKTIMFDSLQWCNRILSPVSVNYPLYLFRQYVKVLVVCLSVVYGCRLYFEWTQIVTILVKQSLNHQTFQWFLIVLLGKLFFFQLTHSLFELDSISVLNYLFYQLTLKVMDPDLYGYSLVDLQYILYTFFH